MTHPLEILLLSLALGADPRAQLQSVQARKAAEEAAAQALQEREGSVLSAVDAAERAFLDADASARDAEGERARAEQRLARARSDAEAAQGELRTLQRALGPRLRVRARLGAISELRLLLGSTSIADLIKRHFSWKRVVAHDLALLTAAQKAVAAREEARAAQAREAARMEALARDAESERDLAASMRLRHRAILGAIRSAVSLHQRAAEEAATQERSLTAFVASLPPSPSGTRLHTGFALLRGRLPRPVAGTVELGFGSVEDPRFHTVTVQKGIDIRAPAGAPVRAVAAGRVAHAGWFRGYGNLVIVDHGDGYHTLVAHLASMSTAMGEEVEAGTLLGTVGDTGSLKGPYLYFEVRDRGRPVDPAAWLRP